MHESSNGSISSQASVTLLVFRHYSRCEVAPHCGLNVHFPNWTLHVEHLFLCLFSFTLTLSTVCLPAEWTKPLEVPSNVPCSLAFIPVHKLFPDSVVPNALSLYLSGQLLHTWPLKLRLVAFPTKPHWVSCPSSALPEYLTTPLLKPLSTLSGDHSLLLSSLHLSSHVEVAQQILDEWLKTFILAKTL